MPAERSPESSLPPPQGVGTGSSPRPRVLVIGAGSCGLVTLRTLRKYGVDAVGFERSDRVGGLWVYRPEDPRCRVYETLCINTSIRQMEVSDFPMPSEFGDFPGHSVIADYFARYAEEFSLRQHIRFNVEVKRVRELSNGKYAVDFGDSTHSSTEEFDAVVVATGHHETPLLPENAENTNDSGRTLTIHSSEYRNPTQPLETRGKRVLVVGFGNSAVDIASDIALRGEPASVLLSVRRGAWVLPKYLRGKPIDDKAVIPLWLPKKFRRRLVTALFRVLRGNMKEFGLPEPDHLIGEAHPTISDSLPTLVRDGKVEIRSALREVSQGVATFADGRQEPVDAAIYCTGYRTEFPFLEPEHVRIENNTVPLFFRLFHPTHRRLFFIGLAQPLGAIFPIAEAQAKLLAEHLTGAYALPETRDIRDAILKENAELARRYVPSARHSMQIDPELYLKALERELHAGRKRASAGKGLAFPNDRPPQS